MWRSTSLPLIKRVVGPALHDVQHTLLVFVNSIFKLGAEHHCRPSGAKATEAPRPRCTVSHGVPMDMLGDTMQVHFCHDDAIGRPCCGDKEGRGRPKPGRKPLGASIEQYEEHVLAPRTNRACGCGCGNSRGLLASSPPQQGGQDLRVLQQRAGDARNGSVHPLARGGRLPVALPALRRPGAEGVRASKVDLLHARETSMIGACLPEYLHLLRSWDHGRPGRHPWGVLYTLQAPVFDNEFTRWARGQVLRLGASVFRRFE